jgi:hypothetical protein
VCAALERVADVAVDGCWYCPQPSPSLKFARQ